MKKKTIKKIKIDKKKVAKASSALDVVKYTMDGMTVSPVGNANIYYPTIVGGSAGGCLPITGGCTTGSGANAITVTTSTGCNSYTIPNIYKKTCSACKKEYETTAWYFSGTSSFPTPTEFIYSGPKIQRNICPKCVTKAYDKLFGVKASELEDILYSNK